MTKHSYVIHINGGYQRNPQTYKFGNTKNITLAIGRQKATVTFEMGKRKTHDELIHFSLKLFRDAYRKVYFLHAIMHGEGLTVRQLLISIDGEERSYDGNTPNFPFLFSMIGKNLCLDPSWEGVTGAFLSTTKTEQDEDLRFSAACAYLASLGRNYEIDRFSNLWTAMNAYYTYRKVCYERYLETVYGVQLDTNKQLKISGEANLIGSLVWQFDGHYKNVDKPEIEKIWRKNYDVEKILAKMKSEELGDLYEASFLALSEEIEFPKIYQSMERRAAEFELTLFSFLLLEYPYHWRCNYFHGNRGTPLVAAYNDYELSVLRCHNYFLQRFLNQEIPKMFKEDFWDETKQRRTEAFVINIQGTEKKQQKCRDIFEQLHARIEKSVK